MAKNLDFEHDPTERYIDIQLLTRGNNIYAHDEALHAEPRLMLHACGLAFKHPEGHMVSWDVKNDWGLD